MKNWIQKELEDYKKLLRALPSLTLTVFTLSVVCMNLLANKELITMQYFALDCGFALSWVSFLCMDVICKRFGPKPAIKVSILAIFINFVVVGIFKILSLTPGMWGEFYTTELPEVNNALNATIGGNWFVVVRSTIAMTIASICNSTLNSLFGKIFKDKGDFKGFAIRSFLSTGISQAIDNFAFCLLVSIPLFGWNLTQAIVCSLFGAGAELLGEVILSPYGYKVYKEWEKDGVGEAYLKEKK